MRAAKNTCRPCKPHPLRLQCFGRVCARVAFLASDYRSFQSLTNMSIYVPDDAPFTAEQRAWLNKFFASMFVQAKPAASSAPVEQKPLSILVGSQTGNSENLARKMAKALSNSPFAATVVDLAQFDPALLANLEHVLIITSTYGDGEPPDNAAAFYQWILSEAAPQLPKLNYSVLSLGDSGYPAFCKCGIDIDQRLLALGAKPIAPRVDCDVDYDDSFKSWKNSVLAALGTASNAASGSDNAGASNEPFSKKNPFPGKVLRRFDLTAKDSVKETIHVEFSLDGSGLEYEAGDALGVIPRNDPKLVADIIKYLPFNTKDTLTLADGSEVSLAEALEAHYDITNLNKSFLEKWQARCGHPYLRALVQGGSAEDFKKFAWGRNLLDLVVDYPADFGDAEEFVGILRKLQPRLYSIASSPKAHPGEVHCTIGVVRFEAHGMQRGGVCSTYLSDRLQGQNPRVFIHSNKAFRLPADTSLPVIMVGPGTGIAPFRAFLEERIATNAQGRNWLFFGNPNAASDFLYEDELLSMEQAGKVRLTTAFSRDQKEKIYVQHRMQEHARELWSWLKNGAYFYVCGDASRMAKDVENTLLAIAAGEGRMSEEQAKEWLQGLKAAKRYQRDVY